MTGKEWSEHFQTLSVERQLKILEALEILDSDPAFRKAYGSDFKELAFFIKCPINSQIFK